MTLGLIKFLKSGPQPLAYHAPKVFMHRFLIHKDFCDRMFIFMHGYIIYMHTNFICMNRNFIFMHENEILMMSKNDSIALILIGIKISGLEQRCRYCGDTAQG